MLLEHTIPDRSKCALKKTILPSQKVRIAAVYFVAIY